MEIKIVEFLNKLGQGTFLDSITNFVSYIPFIIILWAALALIAYIFDKKNGKWVVVAVLMALVFHFAVSEGIFKHFLASNYSSFDRARPWIAHSDVITPIGKQFEDSSFPSSHMASTMAVLTVLVYFYRKTWPYALLFTLIMAFSRMHNGMHYPTDILAGTILGFAYGCLAIYVTNKISAKYQKRT